MRRAKNVLNRALRQARGIDDQVGFPPGFHARPAQPAHRFAYRSVDGCIVQALQETIPGSEVGHAGMSQRLMEFAMFAQPHLGFAKFQPSYASNTESSAVGLVERALAETASVARKHRSGDLQGRTDVNTADVIS